MCSCRTEKDKSGIPNVKPNIVWLVAEDLGPYLPPFGDSTIQTPNLSRLADEGVRYSHVFSVSGVCSPSRAALATGTYPTRIGAHHMRTLFQQPAARAMGLINYECVPPPDVRMVSGILRQNGYYCSNNKKEDYQFHPSEMAWDESSVYAHWRNRPEGIPFFSVFNFGVTHESNLWNPWYRQYDLDTFPPDRSVREHWKSLGERLPKPLFVDEDLDVNVPPYLPDTEPVRRDIRRMYSNIVELDRHIGLLLGQLEEDGLLENTIIVFYTDHGGPLPRQKRLLYDSGLRVPMIIRFPGRENAGKIEKRLISFVDFAPSLLSMAGINPPAFMDGQAFYGRYRAEEPRQYIHAAADRFDESYDMIRAVRDNRFKYLHNFNPEKAYYLPLDYRENMASMQELLRLRDEAKLNEVQMQWFRNSKPEEELFDTERDPHELHNLAVDPAYAEKLMELRRECERWMKETSDLGFVPEEDLIERFWPGKVRPVTAAPDIIRETGKISIRCSTEGASIGYKLSGDHLPGLGWKIYSSPVELPRGETMMVIAHRLGYAPSDTVFVGP
jgi:arylsulfatase A-like enzyme